MFAQEMLPQAFHDERYQFWMFVIVQVIGFLSLWVKSYYNGKKTDELHVKQDVLAGKQDVMAVKQDANTQALDGKLAELIRTQKGLSHAQGHAEGLAAGRAEGTTEVNIELPGPPPAK